LFGNLVDDRRAPGANSRIALKLRPSTTPKKVFSLLSIARGKNVRTRATRAQEFLMAISGSFFSVNRALAATREKF
jgi:hypothetical protein